MGQKIHPLSLRVQSSTRYFDHAWYSNHFFSKMISIDISIFKYLNNFLTLLKLPVGRFSIYHLPKTTKLYSFFCYPKQSRGYKSKIFNIASNLLDLKTKKRKFLSSNQFKSYRNSIIDPLLAQKILYKSNLTKKSQFSFLNSELYLFSNISKIDSIKMSSKKSKNLQKLFNDTKSPVFEQQFSQHILNSYKISNFFLPKNSITDETLLILKEFLLFSKIFKIPYRLKNPLMYKNFKNPSSINKQNFFQNKSSLTTIVNSHNSSMQSMNQISSAWKYNASLETKLSKFLQSDVSLIPFQVNSEWQDAGYFADEIVFLLERRISFRQIKNRIFKQFALTPYIQGVRITCSGRVGGKSKKAQRAKVDSVKYGQTSLHIFSSRIDFAARTAYTSLGSTGVKVWVCYK